MLAATAMTDTRFRGHSLVGRALEWHSRGRRFDSAWLHQPSLAKRVKAAAPKPKGRRRAKLPRASAWQAIGDNLAKRVKAAAPKPKRRRQSFGSASRQSGDKHQRRCAAAGRGVRAPAVVPA